MFSILILIRLTLLSLNYLSLLRVFVLLASPLDVILEDRLIVIIIYKVVKMTDFVIQFSLNDIVKTEFIFLCETIKRLHLDPVMGYIAAVVGLLYFVGSLWTFLMFEEASAIFADKFFSVLTRVLAVFQAINIVRRPSHGLWVFFGQEASPENFWPFCFELATAQSEVVLVKFQPLAQILIGSIWILLQVQSRSVSYIIFVAEEFLEKFPNVRFLQQFMNKGFLFFVGRSLLFLVRRVRRVARLIPTASDFFTDTSTISLHFVLYSRESIQMDF